MVGTKWLCILHAVASTVEEWRQYYMKIGSNGKDSKDIDEVFDAKLRVDHTSLIFTRRRQ